jgi:hypothetical protein
MKFKSFAILAAIAIMSVAVFGMLNTTIVRADEYDKKTIFTFNEDVQVPGKVLPAGTYVFKLLDSDSDRNIVQIFNADETQLVATIFAISDYRTKTPEKAIVSFDERPRGQPQAIRAWFYPGDNYGVEFVYPKQRATELAQATQQPVLSTANEVMDTVVMKTAAVESVTPPPAPTVVPADNNQPTQTDVVMVVESTELPNTASPVPTIALAGIFLLLVAFGIRRFSAVTR